MGADVQDAMERPEGSDEMPPGMKPMSSSEDSTSQSAPSSSKPAAAPKKPEPKQEPKEEPMEVDDPDAQAKKEADAFKAKGNTAYKARQFEEAIEHYSKAWELYPKDVAYLTNLSGERCFHRTKSGIGAN
jgi:stress-induced-phosphoprotein 1